MRTSRTNIKSSAKLKNSKLLKIARKSDTQVGWRTLRKIPALTLEEQENLLHQKVQRRMNQASVGRVLDILKVFDPRKRARIQRTIQAHVNAEWSRENFHRYIKPVLEKELGAKKTDTFISYVNQTTSANFELIKQRLR